MISNWISKLTTINKMYCYDSTQLLHDMVYIRMYVWTVVHVYFEK